MMIVLVRIRVKPEYVMLFQEATIENARNSLQEAGVEKFDFLQQQDDPNHFLLIEIYRSPEDAAAHKDTLNYKKWRDMVSEMMVEPRKSEKYSLLFPVTSFSD